MRCPYCGFLDTQVKDSRPSEDHMAIKRRRLCHECGSRFTTFERVQFVDLSVIKRNGERTPFDRDKLSRSIFTALRKRGVDPERVEKIISSIVKRLEQNGDHEVTSLQIGKLVMESLKDLDPVAAIRFASVYMNFDQVADFNEFIGTLVNKKIELEEKN